MPADKSPRLSVRRPAFLFIGLLTIALFAGGLLFFTRMPEKSYHGPHPLLSMPEMEIRSRLQQHVHFLAGEIGPRTLWNSATLDAAADYIENTLALEGYQVKKQEYEVYNRSTCNLDAELPGQTSPADIIVVGAHYDTVLETPGANDNASGVAALLELARLLRHEKHQRSIRFVAFTNEEPPFYFTDDMGSSRYAKRCREKNEQITAMLSLETLGYYSEQPGSQRYPFPFSLLYPDTADFIAFVGNTTSQKLVRQSIASFRRTAKLPSEGLAAPGFIRGIGWSDHWSFWKAGYPAIMITDTAFFRYAPYHTESDTPEKLDYERMTLLVQGLVAVITDLADARDPLSTREGPEKK